MTVPYIFELFPCVFLKLCIFCLCKIASHLPYHNFSCYDKMPGKGLRKEEDLHLLTVSQQVEFIQGRQGRHWQSLGQLVSTVSTES